MNKIDHFLSLKPFYKAYKLIIFILLPFTSARICLFIKLFDFNIYVLTV